MARNDKRIPRTTEKLIFQQANSRCPFCGCDEVGLLVIHHIVPRASGGSNAPGNLILVCRNCHARIHSGTIPDEEVRRVKRSLGAVIFQMPGTSRRDAATTNVVNIGGDARGSIVAGQVTIQGDAKLPSRMNHPAGSIGADLHKGNYVRYLVGRYNEFREIGQKSYGQKGRFHHSIIHTTIKKKFKTGTYFIAVERFDELVSFLHGKIDKTIQAKRNRAGGSRAYRSFREYLQEQGV